MVYGVPRQPRLYREIPVLGGARRKSLTGSLIIFREGSSGEGKMLQKMEVTEKKLTIGRTQTR